MSGGFRLYFGVFRLALTSPLRTAAWAIAAQALRHWMVPRPPIYRDLPGRIATAWRARGTRSARSAFLATRPTILAVGYLAVFMVGYRQGGPPFRVFDNEFGNLQGRWDTGWYLGIAINGYRYDATRPDGQQNIVFFPAFPMATRVVARLLGASSSGRFLPSDAAAYMTAGTCVVLVAFFGALVYMFLLARELLGAEDEADAAVWLLAAYPFAVFYSAMYTESLFLIGAVGAVYHFRRGEFGRAALWEPSPVSRGPMAASSAFRSAFLR